MNAELQRIARRDKKAFLGDQCKEIEENNRMGKTRDLFKKIRDTEGTFHAKMGSIRDRNKNIQKNYTKKDLHDPDNHEGVINHLEPDILECEVKWALGSITRNKSSGSDGILVDLFQILKDAAGKELNSMSANMEYSAVTTGLEKVSFHYNPKERQCQRTFKLPHNSTDLTR